MKYTQVGNKNKLVWTNWRRFYIKQINRLMSTISYNKLAPSPRPPTSLWTKQIHMSYLNTVHRKFAIATEDKFQDQWTLIQSMQTNKSKINDSNTKTKTPKGNTFKWNICRKITQRSNLWKLVLTFNQLTIIISGL